MLLSVVYTVVNFLSRCRVTQATNTYIRSAKKDGRTEKHHCKHWFLTLVRPQPIFSSKQDFMWKSQTELTFL